MLTSPDRILVEGDLDAVQDWFASRGLTDGLPIVPPTSAKVAAMLAALGESAETSLGTMLPGHTDATLEKLATNAVMAGARPDYFPVIVASVSAMLEPAFNLLNVQSTTHPCAPLTIVSGPIARTLEINGGAGVFGPGFPANATIGRAIRLIMMNVGLAYPGERDRSTQGGPAKFSYCMAENIAESPWPEFHTTQGFAADENAVTVLAGEAPHNVNDHESTSAERFLEIVADVMRTLGHNAWYLTYEGANDFAVVLGPEHAEIVAGAGFTREDVQDFLFGRAVRPIRDLRRGGMWSMRDSPDWMRDDDDDALFACVREAKDIVVLVAGGLGKHSSVIPGFGCSHFASRRIAGGSGR